MANEIWLGLAFGAGMVLQAGLLLKQRFRRSAVASFLKNLATALAVGVFFALNLNQFTNLQFYVGVLCFGFASAFAISFRSRLLLQVHELNLLIFNILLWYVLLENYGFSETLIWWLFVPTVFSLWVIFTKRSLNNFVRWLLYIWCLIILIALAVLGVNFRDFAYLLDGSVSIIKAVSFFFYGGLFLYLWVYIVQLLALFPVSENGKRHATKMDEIKQDALNMAWSFSPTQFSPVVSTSVLVVLTLALFLNSQLHFLPESGMLGLAFLFTSRLGNKKS